MKISDLNIKYDLSVHMTLFIRNLPPMTRIIQIIASTTDLQTHKQLNIETEQMYNKNKKQVDAPAYLL